MRMLKSIFATAYNIKASHSEFDFAIFLRMSHENNIVKLIDITFKNLVYIMFLIGMQATLRLIIFTRLHALRKHSMWNLSRRTSRSLLAQVSL